MWVRYLGDLATERNMKHWAAGLRIKHSANEPSASFLSMCRVAIASVAKACMQSSAAPYEPT